MSGRRLSGNREQLSVDSQLSENRDQRSVFSVAGCGSLIPAGSMR